jgi:hypothetical protein
LEFIRSTFPAGALPRLPAFLVHRHAKPAGFTVSMLYLQHCMEKIKCFVAQTVFFLCFSRVF